MAGCRPQAERVLNHSTQYFPAPAAETTPIIEVLRAWDRAEPGRYPLSFGGYGWFTKTPEDYRESLYIEFACAIDALAERRWSFELIARPGEPARARVTFAPGRVVTASDDDQYAAFVRATVYAISAQVRQGATGDPLVRAVSLTGLPVTGAGADLTGTTPAQDLRVWSRIEPHRFDKGATHYSSPLYRGKGGNVLAPVARAMVVLQYVTTGSVFESAHLHGWTVRLAGIVSAEGRTRYEVVVEFENGQMAGGRFSTPGPACVKAYLAALKLTGDGSISIVPHPRDRFMYPIVVVHTDRRFKYRSYIVREDREAYVTGTFAVSESEFYLKNVPAGMVKLDRQATPEEIEASVAMGILPAPWP